MKYLTILFTAIVCNAQVVMDAYRFGGGTSGNDLLDGLVAYYKFDEASGNALDSSGASRHLTQNSTIATNVGKIEGTRYLDPINSLDYFSHTNDTWNTFGTNDFTILFWMKGGPSDSVVSDHNILIAKHEQTNAGWVLDLSRFDFGDGTYEHSLVFYASPDGTLGSLQNIISIDCGQLSSFSWHMFGVRRATNTWTLFYANEFDATIQTSTASNSIAIFDNSFTPLTIGTDLNGGLPFTDQDFYIDELRISTNAISDCTLYKYFNAGSGLQFSLHNSNTCN